MKETKQASAARAESELRVYIIDDDTSVRTALKRLLISAGIQAWAFAGATDFLAANVPLDGACIITDVKMPGMTGPELQQTLRGRGARVAFIFVTAFDTEEARTQAKQSGAIAYFRKPVDDQALIDAIRWAFSNEKTGK